MTHRLFVAAWIGEPMRREAEQLLVTLRETNADVKWVEPKNLHLTIRFLGSIDASDVPRIEERVARDVESMAPFSFGLGKLGSFGSRGSPNVIWAAVHPGEKEMVEVASRVEKGLVSLGVVEPVTRAFRAHATLGRSRSPRGAKPLAGLLEELSFRSAPELLKEVSLVESKLTPKGPEYVTRMRFPFAGIASRNSSTTKE
ncbi:MAG TPA: RNA 2',3'-cyclic phosphodiesterase [bacterium]|nr:RNA 2',3'-cyclic phosphodiesterase [bacterium]